MSSSRRPPTIDGMTSLKVDNLTYRTTLEELKRVFGKYGEIGDIYIPRDPYTRESRGFAFIRYYDRRDAEDAIDYMDGKSYDGRELRCSMAKYGRPSENRHDRGGGSRRNYHDRDRGYGGRRSRSRSRSPRRRRSRSRTPRRSRSRTPRKDRSRSRTPQRRNSGSPSGSPRRSASPARRSESPPPRDVSRSRSRS